MKFDRQKFFNGFKPYFREVAGRAITPTQVANLDFLLTSFENSDYFSSDIRLPAYALATTHIETYLPRINSRYAPITEGGNRAYFNKYDILHNPRKARELGNLTAGDGYKYRGRGFVQITGKKNYTHFGIADNPDAALEPSTAFRIMEQGMQNGSFTTERLDDYINDEGCDYVNARRVINGLNRATEIAGIARNVEHFLRESLIADSTAPAADDATIEIQPTSGETPTPLTDADGGQPAAGSVTAENEQPAGGESDALAATGGQPDDTTGSASSIEEPPTVKTSLWERVTSKLPFYQQKLDTINSFRSSLNPLTPSLSPISGSSSVMTVAHTIGGALMIAFGMFAHYWPYLLAGTAVVAIGAGVFALAKRNSTARIVAVVAPPAPDQNQSLTVNTTEKKA